MSFSRLPLPHDVQFKMQLHIPSILVASLSSQKHLSVAGRDSVIACMNASVSLLKVLSGLIRPFLDVALNKAISFAQFFAEVIADTSFSSYENSAFWLLGCCIFVAQWLIIGFYCKSLRSIHNLTMLLVPPFSICVQQVLFSDMKHLQQGAFSCHPSVSNTTRKTWDEAFAETMNSFEFDALYDVQTGVTAS